MVVQILTALDDVAGIVDDKQWLEENDRNEEGMFVSAIDQVNAWAAPYIIDLWISAFIEVQLYV